VWIDGEVVGEEGIKSQDGVAVEAVVGGADQEPVASLWFKIIYASRCERPSPLPNSRRRLVSRSE
jgi:hypothetical protein